MREIKFKAWNRKSKKWIYDFNFRSAYDSGTRIIWFKNENGFDENLVEGETCDLVEYTGLKDKNGVEIYEGDVIRNTQHEFNAEITWGIKGESYAGWCFKRLTGHENLPDTGLLFHKNLEKCKVIGNIYENPELLKV